MCLTVCVLVTNPDITVTKPSCNWNRSPVWDLGPYLWCRLKSAATSKTLHYPEFTVP